METSPVAKDRRTLKSAISGALVASLVAVTGAFGATSAQAAPATINVTVSCTANTDVLASPSTDGVSDGDTVNFTFAADCPSTARIYNNKAWSQSGFLPASRPSDAVSQNNTWYIEKSVANSLSTRVMGTDTGGSNLLSVGSSIAIVIPDINANGLAGQVDIKWQGAQSVTPTITSQPASTSKTVGEALTLSVVADNGGNGILSYQWKKDGASLSGKILATLSIPSVTSDDAGSYTVDVVNTQDVQQGYVPTAVTSSAAVVTVNPANNGGGGSDNGGSDNSGSDNSGNESAAVSKSLNKNVSFASGSIVLSKATKAAIKSSVKKAGKKAKYTVTGTAGLVSGVPAQHTKNLAKLRANAVKAYLVKLGVSKKNIKTKTKVIRPGLAPKTKIIAKYTIN
jgi:outer membrane protein OmpA-like peptidoglycan-associated protein